MKYAIIDSKFHGRGILFETSSPRELVRAMRGFRDGCFDGSGCQGFAMSSDHGETWYRIFVEQYPVGTPGCTHHYADMSLYVESSDTVSEGQLVSPENETWSATSLAL